MRKKHDMHSLSRTPEYYAWISARSRCQNPNNPRYSSYGGRGIEMDSSWKEFRNFFNDMGPRPEGMSLDRINNDGPYSPENCRWTTRSQQQRNRRVNVFIEYQGQEKTIAEWAEITGLTHREIRYKHEKGWSAEKIFGALIEKLAE